MTLWMSNLKSLNRESITSIAGITNSVASSTSSIETSPDSSREVTKAISASTFGWISCVMSTTSPSGTHVSPISTPKTGVSRPICTILALDVRPPL